MKPKISSERKKAKGVNKNIVATLTHGWCKEFLLNKKFLGHSMNGIQSKHHKIGSYEIKKISFSCFDDKIYILNNGYDRLALRY